MQKHDGGNIRFRMEVGDWAGGVQLTPKVWTPQRVDAVIIRRAGWLPARMEVRAELLGRRAPYSAAITRLGIDNDGKPISSVMVNRIARELPGMALEVLGSISSPMPGPGDVRLFAGLEPGRAQELADALRRATRRPTTSKTHREDELLEAWETKYQPQGITQKQMAHEVGLEHGALRSYLTHARKRRGQ